MEQIGSKGLLDEVVFRSFSDVLNKRKDKLQKTPNILLREIASLHSNTNLRDLDKDFRADIGGVASSLLSYINHMGFKLVPKDG